MVLIQFHNVISVHFKRALIRSILKIRQKSLIHRRNMVKTVTYSTLRLFSFIFYRVHFFLFRRSVDDVRIFGRDGEEEGGVERKKLIIDAAKTAYYALRRSSLVGIFVIRWKQFTKLSSTHLKRRAMCIHRNPYYWISGKILKYLDFWGLFREYFSKLLHRIL